MSKDAELIKYGMVHLATVKQDTHVIMELADNARLEQLSILLKIGVFVQLPIKSSTLQLASANYVMLIPLLILEKEHVFAIMITLILEELV